MLPSVVIVLTIVCHTTYQDVSTDFCSAFTCPSIKVFMQKNSKAHFNDEGKKQKRHSTLSSSGYLRD